jgi:hypothetical protein
MADEEQSAPKAVSRRRFLTGGALVGGMTLIDAGVPRLRTQTIGVIQQQLGHVQAQPAGPGVAGPTLTLDLRRREDLLYLTFDFYNLRLDTADPTHPVLVKRNNALDASVVVRFPPQHVLEETFDEPLGNGTLRPPPVRSRLAGESRLGFTSVLPLPYTTGALLSWDAWTPRLVPAAAGSSQDPRPPTATETALELPWWLILSPGVGGVWRHHGRRTGGQLLAIQPTLPVTIDGRTDLWQTNLQSRGLLAGRTVRAVWHLDTDANNAPSKYRSTASTPKPFNQPLLPRDWHDIVFNTSRILRDHTPNPLQIDRLSLSALGGTLDASGRWAQSTYNSLVELVQKTYVGRDAFVKVVRAGYLFPFGIPAVHVTVSVRELVTPEDPAGTVAYLRKHSFLVVSPADKNLANGFGQTARGGREMPFTAIRATTLQTPDLLPPADYYDVDKGQAFVPMVHQDDPFRLHFIGRDWTGAETGFTSPVVFVDSVASITKNVSVDGHSVPVVGRVRDHYDNKMDALAVALRTGHLVGSSVAFAPSAKDGDTRHEVHTMTWTSHALDREHTPDELLAAAQPRWYPSLLEASLRLTPAEQVSGRSFGGVPVRYHASYRDNGFAGPNRGHVYLKTVDPPAVHFKGDRCGAVMLPNFGLAGLSRRIGPVGGDLDFAATQGTFAASKFFDGATILGTVDLADIVDDGGGSVPLERAPTISSSRQGSSEVTVLHFETPTKPDLSAPDGTSYFEPGASGTPMVLDAKVVTDLADPTKSLTTVDGTLTDFTMWLLGSGSLAFVELHFSQLRFHAEAGQDAVVDPTIDATAFHGVMEFIQTLSEYLSFGGDGMAIDTEPTQITVSLSFSIPSIELGVFTLENISFGAGLVLPFTGDPAQISFSFCTRDNPFHLTISLFGGGGWFGLTLDMHHVSHFEVGLEFGASAAIDLGVAAGEVHIWAGIYFQLDTNDAGDTHVTLTGYVRAGGSVEVLVIASVSLEAYIGFTFDDDNGTTKVGGEADLTLTVSVLCFSISVSASWEQYFGGEGDPVFEDFFPPDATTYDDDGNPGTPDVPLPIDQWSSASWDDYCLAFATRRPAMADATR